jgi:PKHD-type hydroxylase
MLTIIPDLLTPAQVADLRAQLDVADWIDGNATSGAQSALAKRNTQLPEDSAAARAGGNAVLDALGASPLFVAAALPLKVFPPLFNRYGEGDAFGAHVDTAIRIRRGSDFRIRSDLSATLFLSDPDSYDGGELTITTQFGAQSVKLPAGQLVLYPASSIHHVTPVTRGTRVASFFWIQSMVRDDGARALLFEQDTAIQSIAARLGSDDPEIVRLTGVYHNLLRRWAEV